MCQAGSLLDKSCLFILLLPRVVYEGLQTGIALFLESRVNVGPPLYITFHNLQLMRGDLANSQGGGVPRLDVSVGF